MVGTDIDWMACELIEKIPGKVSGRPIVRGTRILPDAIVDSYDVGETIDELLEGFPSPLCHPDSTLDRVCTYSTSTAQAVKVLLDENLDHGLRHHLGDHQIFTVSYMGWTGLKKESVSDSSRPRQRGPWFFSSCRLWCI
jgi:hypothetical protein